jgi:formiminotetrahydrofolate cyclodeaminase
MLSELRVAELLAALGERTPAPASGTAAAVTAALAAALAELAARYASDDAAATRAHLLGEELLRLGDEDAVAYAAFLADRSAETRAAIVRVPEEIAARADAAAALAAALRGGLRPALAADAEVAVELARAAARAARRLAEVNRPAAAGS